MSYISGLTVCMTSFAVLLISSSGLLPTNVTTPVVAPITARTSSSHTCLTTPNDSLVKHDSNVVVWMATATTEPAPPAAVQMQALWHHMSSGKKMLPAKPLRHKSGSQWFVIWGKGSTCM